MPTKSKAKQDARPDEEIARDIRRALKLDNDVPDEQVRLDVRDGLITLEGSVNRSFQKEAVEDAVNKVIGVRGISNRILVLPAM
jgi:osmotically-inducible protein OsmY